MNPLYQAYIQPLQGCDIQFVDDRSDCATSWHDTLKLNASAVNEQIELEAPFLFLLQNALQIYQTFFDVFSQHFLKYRSE